MHHKEHEKPASTTCFTQTRKFLVALFYSDLFLWVLHSTSVRRAKMTTFISAERIAQLEAIIGYTFNNKYLLEKALRSAGFSGTPREDQRPLAVLGDGTLKVALHLESYETNASSRKSLLYLPYTDRVWCEY